MANHLKRKASVSSSRYSNKSRGMRAKANRDPSHDAQPARSPSASRARRRWAALIKRVWQVDPLHCPRCGGDMKIVSFIEATQPDVIEKILTHCGLPEEPPRAPPTTTSPALGELQYVSDLLFIQDAGPAEPIRSTD